MVIKGAKFNLCQKTKSNISSEQHAGKKPQVGFETQLGKSSLGAQSGKNPPAAWETRARPLCQEDPWRRKWQPTPVLLPGEPHGQRGLAEDGPWVTKSRTRLSD